MNLWVQASVWEYYLIELMIDSFQFLYMLKNWQMYVLTYKADTQ